MDPGMLKNAMEAMNKMNPQQIADMQQHMQSIPPSVLQEQMKIFEGMSAEQKALAAEKAKYVDPQTVAAQAQRLADSAGWNNSQKAEKLKCDGNRLHESKEYDAARRKYEEAISLLGTGPKGQGRSILTACTLNLSSCFLNMGDFQQCIKCCSEVISQDKRNLKARYRRGQAYLSLGAYQEAAADLEVAIETAPLDQKSGIESKFKQAQERLGSITERKGPHTPDESQSSLGERITDDGPQSCTVESPAAVEEPQSDTSPAEQMRATASIMRTNPEYMKQVAAMLKDPANQAVFSHAAGPQTTPDFMLTHLYSLTPTQLESMASMVEANPALLQMGAASLPGDDQASLLQNPETMSAAMRAMQTLPEDQLQTLAQSFGSKQRSATVGLQDDQVRAMMNDPEAMQAMHDVMSQLSPEDLMAMSRHSGVDLTEEQAEHMSNQLKTMSPQQVAFLVKVVSGFQRLRKAVFSRVAFLVGLTVVVAAIVLKLTV